MKPRYIGALAAGCALASAGFLVASVADPTAGAATRSSGTSCQYSAADHSLAVEQHKAGFASLERRGDAIVVLNSSERIIACAGGTATVHNTDLIKATSVSTHDAALFVGLNDSLAPGFTDEGDGTSEIEIHADLPSGLFGGGGLFVIGGRGSDAIATGAIARGAGVNLNPPEQLPDADATLAKGTDLAFFGGRGADSVKKGGKRGAFKGAFPRQADLTGGPGDDRLYAGTLGDIVSGSRGGDRIASFEGNDFLLMRDGHHDAVRCGPGRDFGSADPGDRLRHCEDVTRRRPSSASGAASGRKGAREVISRKRGVTWSAVQVAKRQRELERAFRANSSARLPDRRAK